MRDKPKTRQEAAEYASALMVGDSITKSCVVVGVRETGDTWHFGRQELRILLDYIYGGPPSNKGEEIEAAND